MFAVECTFDVTRFRVNESLKKTPVGVPFHDQYRSWIIGSVHSQVVRENIDADILLHR
jgi:hypothetical protein